MDDARITAFVDPFDDLPGDEAPTRDEQASTGEACGLSSPPGHEPHRPRARSLHSVDTGPVKPTPTGAQGSTPEPPDPKDPDPKDLAEQLLAIARQLRGAEFAADPEVPAENALAAAGSSTEHARQEAPPAEQRQRRRTNAVAARRVYAARRRRGAIFGNPDLFGEPAWDILLDLYIAHAESKDVSVSSACIGSAAPPTTGLRWLGVLAKEGLVRREHDPDDQRRVLVRLTARGLEAMDRYFTLAAGAH
ncbi:MAG: winged helix DNA-binding protein [Erythrobacter sp.]|uniref:winged helix DNA-binding protein n=1 Tax=Erythrobacter sp. TaxID=1042 RepID=UPI0032EAFA50